MDIKAYIESGALESYCLGTLPEEEMLSVEEMCANYPEIKLELKAIELALEKYAYENAIAPKHHLMADITKRLANEPGILPLIGKFSDYRKWLEYVEGLLIEIPTEGLTNHILRNSDGIMQALIVSSIDISNEMHVNEQESFLILKGQCECTVGSSVFQLSEGGYASIPLNQNHNVKILSSYVVAILQHIEI